MASAAPQPPSATLPNTRTASGRRHATDRRVTARSCPANRLGWPGEGHLMPMFHNGNRDLQDLFGSRALADKLVENLRRSEFTDADKAYIESLDYFFLATSDPVGRPDCSFKGGPPGFVRIVQPDLLVWPDYDGNGMFKSLGNIRSEERRV